MSAASMAAQIAFHDDVVLKDFRDRGDLIRSQVFRLQVFRNLDPLDDFERFGRPDAVEIAQRERDALVARDVNTNDTRHNCLFLSVKIDAS